MSELNENNEKCAICESHGIIRYNCTDESVFSDLDNLCSTLHSSPDNRITEYTFVEQITKILSNIKEHFEFTNEEIICLFAATMIEYIAKDVNPNEYIQLHKMESPSLETCYCAICLDDVNIIDTVKFDCSHSFCGGCVIKELEHNKKTNNAKKLACYLCRKSVLDINIYNNNIYCIFEEKLNQKQVQNNESNIN